MSTGLAVVLPLASADAARLSQPGGEPPDGLHLTLFYGGNAAEISSTRLADIKVALSQLGGMSAAPFDASITGFGRFIGVEGGEQDCIVALVSDPAIDRLRAAVLDCLSYFELESQSAHGFVPHVALLYVPTGQAVAMPELPNPRTVHIDGIALWSGNDRDFYPFIAAAQPLTEEIPAMELTTEIAPISTPLAPFILPTVAARAIAPDAPDAKPPLMDNADWNRAHTIGRLRAWASSNGTGDYETLDYPRLSGAFAWVDRSAEAKGSLSGFRLPHHDVMPDGSLGLSKQGLLAASRALMSGEHGIPQSDVPAVRHHLELHFMQLELDPPWRARQIPAAEMRFNGEVVAMEAAPAGSSAVAISWIQVAKLGEFRGHPAGPFRFTASIFDTIIRNFAKTSNRRIPVDYEHATEALDDRVYQDGAPAIGWIVALENRGDGGLWGRVEWVDAQAVAYIREGRYRFFSPAVAFNAIDPVTGEPQGPTLVSGGVTNRPFLDGMAPITARADTVQVEIDISVPALSQPSPPTVQSEPLEPVSIALQGQNVVYRVRADDTAQDGVSTVPCGKATEILTATVQTDVTTLLSSVTSQSVSDATLQVQPDAAYMAVPLPKTLRAALDLAWSTPKSASYRMVAFYGEAMPEQQEEIVETLQCVFGLPRLAGIPECLAALDQLSGYMTGDLGARDGVDAVDIVQCLRCCFGLPALMPAMAVLTAIYNALLPPAATMTVGPSDVHIPSAMQPIASQETTPMSTVTPADVTPALDLAPIATALGMNPASSLAELTAGATALRSAHASAQAEVVALSQRVETFDRKEAETAVDGLIAAKRIEASAREAVIAHRMSSPQSFAAMFPYVAPLPAQAPVPPAPVANLGTAGQMSASLRAPVTAATPPSGASAMSALPIPGDPGYNNKVYTRALALTSATPGLALRDALINAEHEFARARHAGV